MEITNDCAFVQKLEEKARKAEEALEAEQKVRKDLEGLNSKLLAEKTALLDSLAGEKGSLQEYQEKSAKLQAQKNDLDNQLRVSILLFVPLKSENVFLITCNFVVVLINRTPKTVCHKKKMPATNCSNKRRNWNKNAVD